MTSKERPTATITTPYSTPGQTGRFGSEQVAAFRRNRWPLSSECATTPNGRATKSLPTASLGEPGVRIGATNATLKADWTKLFTSLTKTLAQGAITAFGVGTGVGAALGGLDAVSIDEPDESKAWSLTALSLAVAIDSLRQRLFDVDQLDKVSAVFKKVRVETKTALTEDIYYMDADFFMAPAKLLLYQAMRPALVDGLETLALKKAVPKGEMGARLDAAFGLAPIWTGHPA